MRLLRVLLFIPLAVLALEGGARLARPWLARHTPAYYYRDVLEALVKPDPVFIWVGKPNADAELVNSAGEKINYKLNELGWRDKPFRVLELPANAIAFGDSFTFGMGVPSWRRYTEVLEKAFSGLNVWNLGVMGYAPDQYLLLAQRWLPPVPWNFALVQLSNNDVADIAGHEWIRVHSSSGIPAALDPPFSHYLVSGFSEAWNLVAYFVILRNETYNGEELENGLKRLLFSMAEIAKLSRERRIPLLVVQATDWGAPAYGEKIAGEYRDGMIALAKEQNFGLMEAGAVELLPSPDLHWTQLGHFNVAEKLVPAVKEILIPAKPAPRLKK